MSLRLSLSLSASWSLCLSVYWSLCLFVSMSSRLSGIFVDMFSQELDSFAMATFTTDSGGTAADSGGTAAVAGGTAAVAPPAAATPPAVHPPAAHPPGSSWPELQQSRLALGFWISPPARSLSEILTSSYQSDWPGRRQSRLAPGFWISPPQRPPPHPSTWSHRCAALI